MAIISLHPITVVRISGHRRPVRDEPCYVCRWGVDVREPARGLVRYRVCGIGSEPRRAVKILLADAERGQQINKMINGSNKLTSYYGSSNIGAIDDLFTTNPVMDITGMLPCMGRGRIRYVNKMWVVPWHAAHGYRQLTLEGVSRRTK
jgi:hypothetical protein